MHRASFGQLKTPTGGAPATGANGLPPGGLLAHASFSNSVQAARPGAHSNSNSRPGPGPSPAPAAPAPAGGSGSGSSRSMATSEHSAFKSPPAHAHSKHTASANNAGALRLTSTPNNAQPAHVHSHQQQQTMQMQAPLSATAAVNAHLSSQPQSVNAVPTGPSEANLSQSGAELAMLLMAFRDRSQAPPGVPPAAGAGPKGGGASQRAFLNGTAANAH